MAKLRLIFLLLLSGVLAGCAAPDPNAPKTMTRTGFIAHSPEEATSCPQAPNPESLILKPQANTYPSPGKPVKVVMPHFPSCADYRHVSGIVDVEFTVEPDGSVGDLEVVQEVPAAFGFGKAFSDAFAQWKFEPKLVEGKPTAFRAHYHFTARYGG